MKFGSRQRALRGSVLGISIAIAGCGGRTNAADYDEDLSTSGSASAGSGSQSGAGGQGTGVAASGYPFASGTLYGSGEFVVGSGFFSPGSGYASTGFYASSGFYGSTGFYASSGFYGSSGFIVASSGIASTGNSTVGPTGNFSGAFGPSGNFSSGSTGSGGDLDAALDATVPPPPPGYAGFAFIVNGQVQTPMTCPAEDWEYPVPPPQVIPPPTDGSTYIQDDTVCDNGVPPCLGMDEILTNTGTVPVAYTAQTNWNPSSAGEPPGVQFGNMQELSGVMQPGTSIDLTSVYVGGIVAVLGASEPFVDLDSGKYMSDGGEIPWPAGVSGSEGSPTMYVAEIEIVDSCHSPTVVW